MPAAPPSSLPNTHTARALAGLPKISTAFREGKVSYSKVRAMTRVATANNEEALLQMVNIHTDIETLKEDGTGAESEFEDHGHVPAETSRRMACDCSKVHWHEGRNGEPLNIGRKTRSIPPAIRRALQRRDTGCRFPGCTCKRFVDAHHIHHWADGGETSMDNLVLLCRNHHRLVHESGYGVHTDPAGTIHFTLPDGKRIPPGPDTRFRGNVVAIKSANRKNGLDITPQTAIPRWYGDRMNPEMAVDMLLVSE